MQYPPQVNIGDSEIELKGTGDTQEKTFMNVLSTFADLTSIQGIPFIKKANHWWSTAFWTLVFMCAVGMALVQTTQVFRNYFSYEYNTKIDVAYSVLEFPSVTVCNLNPVRMSMLNETNKIFTEYITSLKDKLPLKTVHPNNKGPSPEDGPTEDSSNNICGSSSGTPCGSPVTNSGTQPGPYAPNPSKPGHLDTNPSTPSGISATNSGSSATNSGHLATTTDIPSMATPTNASTLFGSSSTISGTSSGPSSKKAGTSIRSSATTSSTDVGPSTTNTDNSSRSSSTNSSSHSRKQGQSSSRSPGSRRQKVWHFILYYIIFIILAYY